MFNVSLSQSAGLSSRYALEATRDTYAGAEAFVRDRFELVLFESDADYPGCADFFTAGGLVGKIEPAGFTL